MNPTEGTHYSTELESLVLGLALMDNSVLHSLSSQLFYHEMHKAVFRSMEKLFEKDGQFDLVTVTEELQNNPYVTPSKLAALLDGVPKSSKKNIHQYIQRLKYYQIARDLEIKSVRVLESLRLNDRDSVDDLINEMRNSISGTGRETEVLSAEDLIRGYNEFKHQGGGTNIGVPSFDGVSDGLAPGEVMYLMARAKVIKSIFTQNCLRYFAGKYPDDGAIFFSMEMNAPQLGERLLMIETGKHPSEVTEEEYDLVKERHRNIFYITRAALSLRDIYSEIVRLKHKAPIKLVIIDFLTRIRTQTAGEYDFLREATKFLKDMAKELEVALIVLAQVGRETGKDGDVPLSLRSGRGSGTIEEDADFIFGAYRPELNINLDPSDMSTVKNKVCLQLLGTRRTARIEDIFLEFDPKTLRLWELTSTQMDKSGFYNIVKKIKSSFRRENKNRT